MSPDDESPETTLSSGTRLRVNMPLVASEVIDGEAVLIHFETGCYYSAGKGGAEILNLITEGLTLEEIVADLADRYEAPGAVEQDVHRFISRLLEEKLIARVPQDDGGATVPTPTEGRPVIDQVPELLKFTDLEDLLLLDPIHDADEAGWPVAKPDLEAPEG
jgi:Coenzyme PQQ synthesis protein D (PqqD)